MECRVQEIANVLLVQVEGRIDHTVAKVFEDALLPLLDGDIARGKKAVLDLGGVPYMSSAGLRVLTLAAKQCRKQHGEMVIAALQPLLQEVFRISRFDMVFRIFKDVPGALHELSPAAASEYQEELKR